LPLCRRLDKLRVGGRDTNSGIDLLMGRLEDDIITRTYENGNKSVRR